MQILSVVASGNSIYKLAQTYTSNATYTVPNGVYQIAGIAIARGGVAASGNNSSSGNGGAGGGGAGGGAVNGFWAFNVTPGQTWAIGFSTGNTTITKTTDANAYIVAGCGQDASGTTGGAGGLTSRGTSIFTNQSTVAIGGAGGNGGATQFNNDNGNSGSNGGANSLWTPFGFPYPVAGLPTNIYSGAGGGGGGGGARDINGFFFFGGGSGGSPNGGQGGNTAEDFNLSGYSGSNGAGFADGGGGGGGGAFQSGYGAGFGGGVGTSGTGIAYIYER
jgi:hypothetical protein